MSQTSDGDRVGNDPKKDQKKEQNSSRDSSSSATQDSALPSKEPPNSKSNPKSNSKTDNYDKSLHRPQWRLPKVTLPKVKLPLPKVDLHRPSFIKKPYDWLGMILLIILSSYACVGYFLSVLLTIPNRQNLAIAGFSIMGLLPILTAFADYGLMKWGYLISGFLIVGGLYMARLSFSYMFLAVMVWLGITAIAFVGEFLLHKQKHKLLITILILWLPCILGLFLGWQVWRIATNFS